MFDFSMFDLSTFSPATMAKKKKNRPVSSAAASTCTAGAELCSAIKAVQWLASGQGKSDGGVE